MLGFLVSFCTLVPAWFAPQLVADVACLPGNIRGRSGNTLTVRIDNSSHTSSTQICSDTKKKICDRWWRSEPGLSVSSCGVTDLLLSFSLRFKTFLAIIVIYKDGEVLEHLH